MVECRFRVSIFEFRILIYSLETQKQSLDYARNCWDTTLGEKVLAA